MFQPLYVAATGLSAIQDEILNITNNLSNAKTVGFKKERSEMESLFYVEKSFKDVLYQEMANAETPPVNVEYGTGVRITSTPKDLTQGSIETTSSSLDLAIQGDGYFQFKMADGTLAYGRAGNFHLDNDGNLVDPNGRLLSSGLIFPANTTSVVISQDGIVQVAVNNERTLTELGQIPLARFANAAGLKAVGQNLFQATDASGEAVLGTGGADGYGTINQYSLEQSNVDVISEMMRMIVAQRVFDTVTKAVSTYEGMLTKLEQMKQ